MWVLILVSLAVSTVAMTVSKSKIFRPMREKIDEASEFFGNLIGCPYCFAHWVAALFVIVTEVRIEGLQTHDAINAGVTWLAIVAISSFGSGLIFKAFHQMDQ